jgi:serine/threonine-protein kinase
MAPEQFKAQPADARTDQFSFCVALYEALYGAPPFGEGNLAALMADVLAGRVRAAPPKSAVPLWLRRVLLRGLSVAPDSRWASMTALLEALSRDPVTVRRRRATAAGATLLAALSVVTLAGRMSRGPVFCRDGASRLAGLWAADPASPSARPRRETVRAAFLASGEPSASEAWERVAPRIDRYVADWRAMYTENCEATHVRGEQPGDILDLRMTCLDRGRAALAALTDTFAKANRRVVETAVDGVNALPRIEMCGDPKLLKETIARPPDESTRRRVEELRKRLAIAKT